MKFKITFTNILPKNWKDAKAMKKAQFTNIIIVANSREQAKRYASALAKIKKMHCYSLATRI